MAALAQEPGTTEVGSAPGLSLLASLACASGVLLFQAWLGRGILKKFSPQRFILFSLEREIRERERGKLLSCLLHVPQPGMEPTTQAGAPTRDQTGDLLVVGQCSSQLSHTGQGGKKPFFSPSLLRSIPVGRRGRAGTRAAMSWLLSCAGAPGSSLYCCSITCVSTLA